jgi:hypothetical protein
MFTVQVQFFLEWLAIFIDSGIMYYTSGKRAFGLDPLLPAAIWARTKGPATSPQNRLAAREALVPAHNEPLVPVWDTNRD